jgi:hypothetical protein
MSDPLCVRCGRPTDGYACSGCAYRAGDQLHETSDTAPAARDVAHGLSTRSGGSSASGKPGSRLPLDLAATARLDAVEGDQAGWVRITIEERGGSIYFPPGEDRISVQARWLAGHVDWWRHRPAADEFLSAVDACLRVVRGLARGPSEQKYLGPCGAPLIRIDPQDAVDAGIHPANAALGLAPCDGDVYAYRGAKVGRCRTCGAEVATSEREAWLDAEVRAHAFRDREIADAYGVNVKTIRTWVGRGHLVPHGHDADGRPLLNVGDVLDLAAADAARRETDRAKRARRRDTKTEEDAA